MTRYLLIESRDPFEYEAAFRRTCDLAHGLARSGEDVEVFLVQNGVLPARNGAGDGALARLVANDIPVLADDFSLRERAISSEELAGGVRPASIETCVDRLADGDGVLWS